MPKTGGLLNLSMDKEILINIKEVQSLIKDMQSILDMTIEELEQLAKENPPPQEWFEGEEEKPW